MTSVFHTLSANPLAPAISPTSVDAVSQLPSLQDKTNEATGQMRITNIIPIIKGGKEPLRDVFSLAEAEDDFLFVQCNFKNAMREAEYRLTVHEAPSGKQLGKGSLEWAKLMLSKDEKMLFQEIPTQEEQLYLTSGLVRHVCDAIIMVRPTAELHDKTIFFKIGCRVKEGDGSLKSYIKPTPNAITVISKTMQAYYEEELLKANLLNFTLREHVDILHNAVSTFHKFEQPLHLCSGCFSEAEEEDSISLYFWRGDQHSLHKQCLDCWSKGNVKNILYQFYKDKHTLKDDTLVATQYKDGSLTPVTLFELRQYGTAAFNDLGNPPPSDFVVFGDDSSDDEGGMAEGAEGDEDEGMGEDEGMAEEDEEL